MKNRAQFEADFLSKVTKTEGGCWLWDTPAPSTGYGSFRNDAAHRWAYDMWVGLIPEGHEIDHVCHSTDATCSGGPACIHRACVNPEHLEAVTHAENVRRGRVMDGREPKSHCKYGHEKVWYEKANRWQCQTCMVTTSREFNRRRRDEKRMAEGVQPQGKPGHISAAVGEYLRLRRGQTAASTYRCESADLGAFATALECPLKELTAQQVENYFYGPGGRAETVSGGTFNNTRARVLQFTQWLMDEGHVQENLMRNVKRRKAAKRDYRRLTPDQMVQAITTCEHPRDRVALAIACNTGLRVSSIRELRVRDIDLEHGAIHYVNVKLQRERSLPISADLDTELRRWLGHYTEECGPLQPGWYLVPARPRGGLDGEGNTLVPTKPSNGSRRIAKDALDQLGVDARGEGFHSFRRSSSRALFEKILESGDPRAIHIVQSFLDHSSPNQTQTYIGTSFEAEKLNDLLKGKRFLQPAETAVDDNVIDFASRRKRSG